MILRVSSNQNGFTILWFHDSVFLRFYYYDDKGGFRSCCSLFYQFPGYSCIPVNWAGSPQELAPTLWAPWESLGFQQAPTCAVWDPLVLSTGFAVPLQWPSAQEMGCGSAMLFWLQALDKRITVSCGTRAQWCHVLQSPDSLWTHSASSESPGAVWRLWAVRCPVSSHTVCPPS